MKSSTWPPLDYICIYRYVSNYYSYVNGLYTINSMTDVFIYIVTWPLDYIYISGPLCVQ